MSKKRFKVEVPDIEYYERMVKCKSACPVGTDVRGYLQAIDEGDFDKAYLIARAHNPFTSACGQVCGAPCEAACRRGTLDAPGAIRALKRFVAEKSGVKALPPDELLKELGVSREEPKDQKVAIIGSGPGGLSAAYELALRGYKVTVFESAPAAGGMMALGIPRYRLSRELVNAEIEAILALGVELHLKAPVGKDITVSGLLKEQGYGAVLIAVGLQKSRRLSLPGADAEGVLPGIEFLRKVNLGEEVKIGKKVIVIGGGNVAYDAARSCVRLGAEEVHVVCLEARHEMLADEVEIEEGAEEGIILHTSKGPKRVVESDGKVAGLETIACSSVFDEEGKFNPSFVEGAESVIEADTIILTIGQAADLSFIAGQNEAEAAHGGRLMVDPDTLQVKGLPGVFACGDVATGPKLLIDAIASGQRAAKAIDAYLSGKRLRVEKKMNFEPAAPRPLSSDYDRTGRLNTPCLPVDERKASLDAAVELTLSEEAAKREANRCLRCNINTIFDGEKCILCGGCVDICPVNCLRMATLNEMEGDDALTALIEKIYGVSPADVLKDPSLHREGTAIIKDEEKCIRCGLCMDRCPTGAVTLETVNVELEELVE